MTPSREPYAAGPVHLIRRVVPIGLVTGSVWLGRLAQRSSASGLGDPANELSDQRTVPCRRIPCAAGRTVARQPSVPMTGQLDRDAERRRLEAVAADSWYEHWVNAAGIRYGGRIFDRYWRGGRCLEMGPAEGVMTEQLVGRFEEVVVVDGSENFCSTLRERFPGTEVVCALFEDYQPTGLFDAVVLGHVLEHVADPVNLLKAVGPWLSEGGAVYASVPNARSLHRQAAVLMGLLDTEHTFSESDRHHGHRRIYDPERLRADFLSAGFEILVFGGYWLKPLSNGQITKDWAPEMLDAFMALGERYPDIAGEIYVIARPAQTVRQRTRNE